VSDGSHRLKGGAETEAEKVLTRITPLETVPSGGGAKNYRVADDFVQDAKWNIDPPPQDAV
jgi:hypothetical protein